MLVKAFIVTFVIVQTGLTITESAKSVSDQYLWRMFAVKVPRLNVQLVTAGGAHRTLDWSKHVAYARKGLDFWTLLPPQLCAVYPDAAFIEMRREPSEYKKVPCSR